MDFSDRSKLIDIISRKAAGGDIDSAESELVERWCEASSANRDIYRRLMTGESLRNAAGILPDKKAVIRGVNRKLALRRRRSLLMAAVSAAAVIAVLVYFVVRPGQPVVDSADGMQEQIAAVMTLSDGREVKLSQEDTEDAWQQYTRTSDSTSISSDVKDIKITIPRGHKYKLRLSDGSMVWLNEETVFEYPESFTTGERQVTLTGEAYFDISRDEDCPFRVMTTDNIDVEVMGTQFNVTSYTDMFSVRVTLTEGSVAVNSQSGHLRLEPGQQAVIDRETGNMSVEEVDTAGYMEWIYGMFNFEHMPLADVIKQIEQWYGIALDYDADAVSGFGTVTFHAVRYADSRKVLEILSQMTGIDYNEKE